MAMTADAFDNPYAHMIDPSNKATLSRTFGDASEAARKDAAEFETLATNLRREAAANAKREGMAESASNMRAEANRAAETADQRRGMAAAYSNAVSQLQTPTTQAS